MTNIHQILNSIRLAASTKDMTKSLQLGNSTLQHLLSTIEKKEDIDTLYLDLNEHMLKEREFSSLLTPITSSQLGDIEEEAQLEEELDKLLKEKEKESYPARELEKMEIEPKKPSFDKSDFLTSRNTHFTESQKIDDSSAKFELNSEPSLESVASILKRISMNE